MTALVTSARVSEITGRTLRWVQSAAARGVIPSASKPKGCGVWMFDENRLRRWVRRGGLEKLDAEEAAAKILINRLRRSVGDENWTRHWKGNVYFIRCGRFIKIGIALNVGRRCADLQGANPHELVLLGSIKGTVELEKAIHDLFKKLRERGEWFRAKKTLTDFIDETLRLENG